MPPQELFLSHSDHDRRFAAALVRVLQHYDIQVWYSRRNIVGAQQWHDQIGTALRRCDWFAIILSPNSVQSEWVKHELLFALNHTVYRGRIIPILYRPCDYESLSWTLSGFQMIDFTQRHTTGYRDLLRVWEIDYRTR
jgi:hypothetical protein